MAHYDDVNLDDLSIDNDDLEKYKKKKSACPDLLADKRRNDGHALSMIEVEQF